MKIIVRVRELRKHHNLTQEELAKRLNISRQSLISLEQGRWLPSLPLAIQLAEFFNTPLEQVISTNPTIQVRQLTNEEKEAIMARDIAPWSPFRELRDMRDEIDRIFDQTLTTPAGGPTIFPTINMRQDDKSVIVEAQVPGFKESEIDIDVAEDMITISGQKEEEKKEEEGGYVRREHHVQSFSRTIPLPAPVITDQAEAKIAHGVLQIIMPKIAEEKPKTTRLKPKA